MLPVVLLGAVRTRTYMIYCGLYNYSSTRTGEQPVRTRDSQWNLELNAKIASGWFRMFRTSKIPGFGPQKGALS